METFVQKGYGIPTAIIIAGVLIAGAVLLAGGQGRGSNDPASLAGASVREESTDSHAAGISAGDFRIPDENDHTLGNPDASIAIVEFSDFECPFCAQLHPTLARIVEEQSDVKWVYRHFPLSTIHASALPAATASECVARLAGNDAFWQFADAAFENHRQLSDSWYSDQAVSLGIDPVDFGSCMSDQDITALIQEDIDEAVASGGRGTPYVVVVTPKGNLRPFSGALPYNQILSLVNQARAN